MPTTPTRAALGWCSLVAATTLAVACALAGCQRALPSVPLANLNPQQARGHQVFQTRCSLCHYDRELGSLQGPSLVNVFQKPYLHSGAPATDDRVTDTVLHGHSLMPAQPDIDPQDLEDLLAYLHTL